MVFRNVVIQEHTWSLIGDTKLVLKGKGRLINRPTKTGGKKYDKFFIYIPTDVAKDSSFPFEKGDKITVEIQPDKDRLLIERC